ncbi:Uma2 family endonuclease [Desulfococcaceae bacterium HSG8]|nr:Uma2 family endonuclease [Desulfococcaceae bacterium HSG8]
MLQAKRKFISPDEYFTAEESAECKSEYYHGEVFAMTGASVNHNLITSNVIISLGNSLQNSSCLIFPSDIKVQMDKDFHYAYPDVSLVCGDIEYAENRNDIIANPSVIFEILSESTKDYDRGSKFTAYRNISSLKDYILIDQYSIFVEHFFKQDENEWGLKIFKNISDQFHIRSIDAVPLASVYKNIIVNSPLSVATDNGLQTTNNGHDYDNHT